MKIKFKQEHFSDSVREKIFDTMIDQKRRIGLREFAKTIDISPATLSRIEHGKPPDIETFFKLCHWMKKSSNEFYNY